MRKYFKYGFVLGLLQIFGQSFGQKPIGHFTCGHASHQLTASTKKANKFDVLHYDIQLDFTDFANQRFFGYTTVTISAETALSEIQLQLEGLTIDSIIQDAQQLSYTRSGINVDITLAKALKSEEESKIFVYYNGKPEKDASWGGFYYSGEYAFNLGVAFTSNPHNYGRVWFPCVDNFTDRATYSFGITTTSDKKALCNGTANGVTVHGNGTHTFHWDLKQPIPTYLASVAIAPYALTQYDHNGIPVILSCLPEDSSNMMKSFEHLNGCIDAYLNRYGSHTFDRIGFNVVPFNGGAMEHATNIAYPLFGVDGEYTYETLYAHELGHHWWGNTVTCRTAEDMWINEGWASYSERVFLEWIYGKQRYDEDISANHRAVLHYAHLRDGDTLPVSGIGHNHTYGSHVYDKGADMVHTLRGYMGDSAFFSAVQSFLTKYKFQDVSSQDLESHFQLHTTRNLNSFFKNWIYNPGFPHFSVLGYSSKRNGSKYATTIHVGQRLRFAPEYFEDVPMDITCYSSDFRTETFNVKLGKERQEILITTDFVPTYVALDINKKISDAITDDAFMVSDTGTFDFGDAMMTMKVKQNKDSSFVRVEHNWVGADAYFNDGKLPFVSRERYWTVDGVWNKGFKADATIEYFGRETGSNYLIGYLDVDLIRGTEENLVLMYRSSPSTQWGVCKDYTWEMGSKFDKRGSFTIHNVQKGQYTFGINEASRLGVKSESTASDKYITVYPNPTTDSLNIMIDDALNGVLEITDGSGRLVTSEIIQSVNESKSFDVSEWAPGIYYVGVVINNQPYNPKLVLVR